MYRVVTNGVQFKAQEGELILGSKPKLYSWVDVQYFDNKEKAIARRDYYNLGWTEVDE